MGKHIENKKAVIDLGIDLYTPIEVGVDIRSLGIPSWDITFLMLNEYIQTYDVEVKERLIAILSVYEKEKEKMTDLEEVIQLIVDTSIIKSIIKEDNPPSYEEAINIINKDILEQYINITNTNIEGLKPLNHFIALTIEPIAFNLYNIYNIDQYNEYIKQIDFIQNKRMEYINNYKEANSTDEKLRLQKELADWESDTNRDEFMFDYIAKTFEVYKTDSAINTILEALEINNNKIRYELDTLDSIIPEKHMIPNNRLIQKLMSGDVREGTSELIVSGARRKEIITLVDINYDDEDIRIRDKDKRFTNKHRSVYNALASIWEAGNEFFTANQVYRCMNGFNNTEKVSDKWVDEVTKLIDENRKIYARIDYTKEAKSNNAKVDKYIVEDYIISAKKVTLAAGGTTVEGYKFNSKPILYEYAQVSKQVYTVPSYLLNIKDYLANTPETAIMKDYFIISIEWMNSKKNPRSRNLTLKSIYNEIGLVDPPSYKAQRVRNNAAKILDSFIDKKYIKDYKFYKEGRSYKGIEIIL